MNTNLTQNTANRLGFAVLTLVAVALLTGIVNAAITPVPEKIPFAVSDKQDFQIPDLSLIHI